MKAIDMYPYYHIYMTAIKRGEMQSKDKVLLFNTFMATSLWMRIRNLGGDESKLTEGLNSAPVNISAWCTWSPMEDAAHRDALVVTEVANAYGIDSINLGLRGYFSHYCSTFDSYRSKRRWLST